MVPALSRSFSCFSSAAESTTAPLANPITSAKMALSLRIWATMKSSKRLSFRAADFVTDLITESVNASIGLNTSWTPADAFSPPKPPARIAGYANPTSKAAKSEVSLSAFIRSMSQNRAIGIAR